MLNFANSFLSSPHQIIIVKNKLKQVCTVTDNAIHKIFFSHTICCFFFYNETEPYNELYIYVQGKNLIKTQIMKLGNWKFGKKIKSLTVNKKIPVHEIKP